MVPAASPQYVHVDVCIGGIRIYKLRSGVGCSLPVTPQSNVEKWGDTHTIASIMRVCVWMWGGLHLHHCK